MVVPFPREAPLILGDLIFQMETEGGQEVHETFTEIGFASTQSLATDLYYDVIILGSS
jgi:hypothetical protein